MPFQRQVFEEWRQRTWQDWKDCQHERLVELQQLHQSKTSGWVQYRSSLLQDTHTAFYGIQIDS